MATIGSYTMPDCSVGIMAYNEEHNIADAIGSILEQRLSAGRIAELIVVASGCEDRTCAIVARLADRDPRIRLVEQPRREGKASAINMFIGAARSPLLVMASADIVLAGEALDAMLGHFADPAVGMVGGRPTPVNGEDTFLGHAVHLQWRLHHQIARRSPKLGEIVAFRNVVPSIPLDTAVDELSIQALITQLGYELVYEPRAVIYNRGPATVPDFLRQRRRIYAGHLRVRERQGYSASTMSAWRVVAALASSGAFATPRGLAWTLATVGLESAARALGAYDVLRGRSAHVWEMCDTTKQHVAAAMAGQHSVAVFHIVNFHRTELEIGPHASRQVVRRVADSITHQIGPAARVSVQQGGTIIALFSGDRENAKQAARRVVQRFQPRAVPMNGHGATAQVTLACGVVAFPQEPPAQPVPVYGAEPVPEFVS